MVLLLLELEVFDQLTNQIKQQNIFYVFSGFGSDAVLSHSVLMAAKM